jgi:hypothetical protein
MPLLGIEFEEDNGRVFNILKSLLINGPAWTWMRVYNNTHNGRQAWLALITHFEGDAQRDRVKDKAYAVIAAAKYYSEKKKFSFETYVMIHQDAYADLEQYGEQISEEKRVRDLLMGIKDSSQAAIAARMSFANAVAHLATTQQLNSTLLQDTRNISSTNTGRGDGRGHGQGFIPGHGRGRNIYLGSYSPDQWKKLSPEDHKKIIEGRQQSIPNQKNQATQDGGRGGGRGRTISSTITGSDDAQSAITGATMGDFRAIHPSRYSARKFRYRRKM